MRLFDLLTGKKRPSAKDFDKLPPVYGGGATSPYAAVTINWASMQMAHHLIDRFISERHGRKDVDWNRSIEFFVNEVRVPEFTVSAIGVKTASGKNLTYYFNVGRPMNATKNLMKMVGQLPEAM